MEASHENDQLVSLIEEAIKIELLQYVFVYTIWEDAYVSFRSSIHQLKSVEDHCPDTLNDNRRSLQKAIGQWRTLFRRLFPQPPPHSTADFPENETLELPSSYKIIDFQQFGLSALAQLEYQVRLGHAYDAVDDIRASIHIYNVNTLEKRTQVFGQRSTTRAWTILNSLKDDTRECAKRYRSAYSALLALGLPENSELKPIEDRDLWGRDVTSVTKPGDSKRQEPWFWVIGKPMDLPADAWELECKSSFLQFNSMAYVNKVERVRWFRMRAARDRYREEVEILNEEFQRMYTSFTRMSVIWKTIGDKEFELRKGDSRLANGYRAFAYRQTAMYEKLTHNTLENWKKARSYTKPTATVTTHS